jgi:hypothetical protein
MAGTSTRRARRQKETINCPNGTWSAPIALNRLGWSGLLSRSVLRAPAGTASTAADIMVWMGGLTDDATVTDPAATIPTEDRVFYRSAIVVAGSAVDADDDYDILSQHNGASYDIRDSTSEMMWISVKSTGAEPAMVWSLEAVDTL